MAGMTWIFLIRQWLSSPLHWKEVEAHYFPSCVHVLTETKFKQDEQTMEAKMEQLDRQMQALLKKSEDDQKKNDYVDNMEQMDLRNNFTRSSTDDEVCLPDDPGALSMANLGTPGVGRGELANRRLGAPVDDHHYDEAATIAKPALDSIVANKEDGGYLATEQTVTEAAQTLQEIKYIEAKAANETIAAAEKRIADMVKQINEMNATMKDTHARLSAEKQATEMAKQIKQAEAARLGAEKKAAEMAKQIEAMQAEAARLAAEKNATKPREGGTSSSVMQKETYF